MALSGKLEADFSSFQREVDKAVVSLRGFEQESEKVGTSLSRMADRYSGTKIIEKGLEINRLFKTTQDLALLTEKELAEVGRTAAEAADKMTRLGLEVPANLRQIASEATTTGGAFSKMLEVAGGMGLVTSIESALGWLKQFTAEIFRSADEMQKLSDRTAISAEDLQRFQAAGTMAGNTIAEISGAITTMQDRLASGDKSAIAALDRLGLSLQDLEALSPADRFRAIAAAIAEVQDPAQQIRIAIDLFGKTGAAILPTIKSDIEAIGRATITMSNETTKALSDAGGKWSLFWGNIKSLGGEVIADVLTLSLSKTRQLQSEFNNLAQQSVTNAPKIAAIAPPELPANLDAIEKELTDNVEAMQMAGAEANFYADQVFELSKIMENLETKTHGLAMKNERELAGERQKNLNARNADVIAGFNQIQALEAQNTDFIKKQTLTATEYQLQKIDEWARAQIAAFKGTEEELVRFTEQVKIRANQQKQAFEEALPPIVTLIGKSVSEAAKQSGDTIVSEYQRQTTAFEQFKGVVVAGTSQLIGSSEALRNVMNQTMRSMSDYIERDFQMQQAQRDRGEFFMPGMSTHPQPGLTGWNFRAAGGPVSAGQSYVVGERGPELFRPSSSGTIVPNSGMPTVNNTIYVNGSIRDIAPQLVAELTRLMKQSRQWPTA